MFKIFLVPRIQNGQSSFEFHSPQISLQVDTLLGRFVRKNYPISSACSPLGRAVDRSEAGTLSAVRPSSLSPKRNLAQGLLGGTRWHHCRSQGCICRLSRPSQGPGGGRTQLQLAPWGWDPVCPQDPFGIKEKEHMWSFHAHLLMWESGWKCCIPTSNDQEAMYLMPFLNSYYWKYFDKKSQTWPELGFLLRACDLPTKENKERDLEKKQP